MKLGKVNAAVKEAKPKLPETKAITDIAYHVDVDPSGSQSLVLYVVVKQGEIALKTKRAIESELRSALRKAYKHDVYFRWRTAAEQKQVAKTNGFIDSAVSALA